MKKQLDTPAESQDQIIDHFNLGASGVTNIVNRIYQMNSPFLVTMEYCSGIHSPEDWVCLAQVTPDSSFYSVLYQNSKFPLHQHDFYELMLVLKGSVIQVIENKEYMYTAGSACLVNRNVLHAEKFIGEAQLLFVGISVSFISSIMKICKTPLFSQENDFFSSSLWIFFQEDIENIHQKVYIDFFPAVTSHSTDRQLRAHAEKMFELSLFPQFGTTPGIMASICSLFRLFCDQTQYHISFIHLDSRPDYLLFCRITHIIEEKEGQISRQELQEILHYSSDYLTRIIKKYSGKNLFDYAMTFRLNKLCQLITCTNRPIALIAEELGFTNRYHFYKIFKEKYGMTPNEYRRTYQDTSAL